MKAIPVERGCGEREQGGVYAEFGVAPDGAGLEDFLIDAPLCIDLAALGVRPIGVSLVCRQGVWHVIDWVGLEHYPNVADFVEEVRRFGVSRRLPRSLDFSRLTPASRLLLVHARAHVDNFHAYADRWIGRGTKRGTCPKRLEEHMQHDYPLMCAAIWWQDVVGGRVLDPVAPRIVHRTMPSFSYIAAAAPQGVQAHYLPAVFASFPVSRLVLVDPKGEHGETQARAARSSLPVEVEPR